MVRPAVPLALCCLLAVESAVADDNSVAMQRAAGLAALERGRPAEAARLLTEALKSADTADADAVLVANLRIELARAQSDRGRYGLADEQLRRAHDLLTAKGTRREAEIANCLTVRAENLRRVGLYRDAALLGRQALALRERALGREHPDLAETLETLGRIFLDQPEESSGEVRPNEYHSQTGEAIVRAWDLREKARRQNLPSAVPVLLLRAASARPYDGGKPEAERRVRAALDSATKHLGPDHPVRAECLLALAEAGIDQKEAEGALKEALTLLAKSPDAYSHLVERALAVRSRHLYCQGRLSEAETSFAESLRSRFRGLSDAELCVLFRQAAVHQVGRRSLSREGNTYERLLVEMAQRKGSLIEDCLNEHSGARDREMLKEHPRLQNLEVLTALRRVQGKPDPVPVEVAGPEHLISVYPDIPDLAVALRNRDGGGDPIAIVLGGDYRSGRPARWCVQVHDSRGRLLPGVPRLDSIGGGILLETALEPGKADEAVLGGRKFVEIPGPGEYTFRILHHDSVCLADLGGTPDEVTTGDRITCRSKTLRLTVRPREIAVTPADRAETQKLLDALDPGGPVVVAAGTYGKWAHELIPPESPTGKLLTRRWQAVPTLLEELERKELGEKRRARVLALLFSITGRNDPRGDCRFFPDESKVLGSYTAQDGPWTVSADPGKIAGAGWSDPYSVKGTIDPEQQKEFARRWLAWKKFLVLRETSAP
jgi:tetratricopeptide (TPR) repeat protein